MTCGRDAAALRDRDKRFSSAIFTWPSGRFLYLESLQASVLVPWRAQSFHTARSRGENNANLAESANLRVSSDVDPRTIDASREPLLLNITTK